MSRERATTVGGQNEASDIESFGGHSRRLFACLHFASHEALVLRRKYQISQREDAVRSLRRAESFSTDERHWVVEAQPGRRERQNYSHRNHTAENVGSL